MKKKIFVKKLTPSRRKQATTPLRDFHYKAKRCASEQEPHHVEVDAPRTLKRSMSFNTGIDHLSSVSSLSEKKKRRHSARVDEQVEKDKEKEKKRFWFASSELETVTDDKPSPDQPNTLVGLVSDTESPTSDQATKLVGLVSDSEFSTGFLSSNGEVSSNGGNSEAKEARSEESGETRGAGESKVPSPRKKKAVRRISKTAGDLKKLKDDVSDSLVFRSASPSQQRVPSRQRFSFGLKNNRGEASRKDKKEEGGKWTPLPKRKDEQKGGSLEIQTLAHGSLSTTPQSELKRSLTSSDLTPHSSPSLIGIRKTSSTPNTSKDRKEVVFVDDNEVEDKVLINLSFIQMATRSKSSPTMNTEDLEEDEKDSDQETNTLADLFFSMPVNLKRGHRRAKSDVNGAVVSEAEFKITTKELKQISKELKESLTFEKKSRHWKFYYCFTGKSAVQWIVKKKGWDFNKAVKLGEEMIAKKIIKHLVDKSLPFLNTSEYYTFIENEEKELVLSAEGLLGELSKSTLSIQTVAHQLIVDWIIMDERYGELYYTTAVEFDEEEIWRHKKDRSLKEKEKCANLTVLHSVDPELLLCCEGKIILIGIDGTSSSLAGFEKHISKIDVEKDIVIIAAVRERKLPDRLEMLARNAEERVSWEYNLFLIVRQFLTPIRNQLLEMKANFMIVSPRASNSRKKLLQLVVDYGCTDVVISSHEKGEHSKIADTGRIRSTQRYFKKHSKDVDLIIY